MAHTVRHSILHRAACDMYLHTTGTSNKPLAGAVLCCTSIAPEQRVRAPAFEICPCLTTRPDNPWQHRRRPGCNHQARPHLRRNTPHRWQHRQRQIPLCGQMQRGCQSARARVARGNARDLARGTRRPGRGCTRSRASSPNVPWAEGLFDWV
jgi:hypothetical protein